MSELSKTTDAGREILDLPAREILTAFRNRNLSPVEYMTALIARVEASEPKVKALYLFRPEEALEEARAAEARYAKGAPAGCLDGMPVTIKELIATKGDPVPVGTAATELVPAPADAPTAARLREEGAILYAKTTCPDYGMLTSGLSSFHPLSRNPWDLTQNPGGSSAGAAAAAAAGYGPLHIGTDIGGSIRLPAGWTGLFGLKPSLGRVPIDPYYTGRVAGPMTPTVDDSALLMDVITRPDWRDATSLPYEKLNWDAPAADVRGLKIGLMLDAGCGNETAPEILDAVSQAADLFASHGAEVVPIAPVLTREMLDGLDYAWRARFWGIMNDLSEAQRAKILPYIHDWAEAGAHVSPQDVATGFDQTFAMRRSTSEAFQKVDVILSPVNPNVSYPADWASPTNDPARPFEHICFTVPWNMGEQPACSINCGFTQSGMPIGLQIIAPRFQDQMVFSLARAYENWRGPITNWPRIDA
ncbi:amidase [Paracoccus seriniphilus]|uniref:Aspartyl-tRNA(Asn)/glutamyl-tRNA(Gln) amidotransferase subunit A n=1 Tax=Paracoccus seriniphilus TaxID=184748 RepID=A0A239PUV9_9RHOB|nr:amidase [Paracoccus seriniphilus]WCR15458.1 amidase [Paracoccus seriniphilus]SNT73950.1 aspartyl-tRNA(Asn)/glutamyl-tRNA(Gln) amidotransferase subunit A [Paracoccus seriniphilus]